MPNADEDRSPYELPRLGCFQASWLEEADVTTAEAPAAETPACPPPPLEPALVLAAEADAASEGVKREWSSKLEEQTSRLEEALAELEKLRTEREEQDRKIGTVLEANDAMERQLKELNAVVEGVVKRELQRVKTVNEARAGRHGGRDPRSRFGR